MGAYILAVDTDTENIGRQSTAWEKHGIWVDPVSSMQEAIARLDKKPYIAVGINADCIHYKPQLGILRDATTLPVHVLTSSYSIDEHVDALNRGADAYADWREQPEENVLRGLALFARINERVQQAKPPVQFLAYKGLQIYPSYFTAVVHDEPVELTKREFDVLYCLLRNRDRILTPDILYKCGWNDEYDPSCANRLWVQVSRLREKLAEAPGCPGRIETVKELGYRFSTRIENEADTDRKIP